MGRIGRGRADNAGFSPQQAVDFLDGVAKPVEKDNVICGDLGFAATVGPLCQKLTGLRDALGRTVAVAAIRHGQIGNDLLHPLGDDFSLGDRVADVLHVGLDAERLELVGDLDDGPDFVGQLAGADMNDIVAHDLCSFPFHPLKLKRPWAFAHGLDSVKAAISIQGNGQVHGMRPPRLPRCSPGPILLLRCLRLPCTWKTPLLGIDANLLSQLSGGVNDLLCPRHNNLGGERLEKTP